MNAIKNPQEEGNKLVFDDSIISEESNNVNLLTVEQAIETGKNFHTVLLPAEIKQIVSTLKPFRPTFKEYNFLNIVLPKLARFYTTKRLRGLTTSVPKIMNLYSMVLASSGTGKGFTNDYMNNLVLIRFWDDYYKRQKKAKSEIHTEAKRKYAELYGGKTDLNREEPKPDENEFIRNYKKNNFLSIMDEINDGTVEGLNVMGQEILRRKSGSIYNYIEEFADYVDKPKQDKLAFISAMKELYDGNIASKQIKGNRDGDMRESNTVRGVDSVCLLCTTPEKFEKQGEARENFENLCKTGFTRRFFVTYQARELIMPSNLTQDEEKELEYLLKQLGEEMFSKYQQLEQETDEEKNTGTIIFKMDNDAYRIYKEYTEDIAIKEQNKILIANNMQTTIELSEWDNDRKVLSLAVFFASINHPRTHLIFKTDVLQAISTTEFIGRGLSAFNKATAEKKQNNSLANKLIELFKKHRGEEFTKTKLIQKHSIELGGNTGNRLSREIDMDLLEYIKECFESANETFIIEEKMGGNNKKNISFALTKSCETVPNFEEVVL